jgi:hypothetical protein
MILFISYASEDEPFVRVLAEALSKQYEKVWYAPYELTLGDSLLKKINAGLGSCDYGIVVLSKHFFSKKWPQAELDGLFALEDQTRKIILPIWKDIMEEEVKSYSPILAGRLAVSSKQGLQKVLDAIRMAVNASERQRSFTILETASQRVQRFKQTMEEKQRTQQLLFSEQGVALISAGVQTLWQMIQQLLSSGESDKVKFAFSKNEFGNMYARTVRGMYLGIRMRNLCVNSAMGSFLETKIFRQAFDRFGELTGDRTDLNDTGFKPSFRAGDELIWVDAKTSEAFSNEELAAHLINLFLGHVEEATAESE